MADETASIAKKARRTVHYSSIPAFRKDAEKLAAGPHETVGSWSYGQILRHLADSVNASFDGYPFRVPWYLRAVRPVAGWFLKRSLLSQPLRPGIRIPKFARRMVPAAGTTTEEGLRQLQAALDRFEAESPEMLHPFLGRMSPEEWVAFHLRHAELHMSFVRPT